jgi:hypothetical protein
VSPTRTPRASTSADHAQRLVPLRARQRRIDAEAFELDRGRGASRAELNPALAHDVEHRGFTCDATLCTSSKHDLVFDACLGLQDCDQSEVFKAETAAGCSCCASQLCNSVANTDTEHAVFALEAAQRQQGETPQCDINGTLCGTPP